MLKRFDLWHIKQYFQYLCGDIKLVHTKKYSLKQYFFWRNRIYINLRHLDKTFYIIRRRSGHGKLEGSQKMGIAGLALFTLGDIQYALKKNYIPVIDFMTYSNTYLDERDVNRYNAWNFFFKSKYLPTINNLRKKGNVILSSGILQENMPDYDLLMDNNPSNLNIDMWKSIARKYLKLNSDLENKANTYIQKNIINYRVLGVLCRGTDYLKLHPKNHPIQPEPTVVIEKAEELMKDMKLDRLYLATEDIGIYKLFKEKFSEKMFIYSIPDSEYKDGYYIENVKQDTQIRKLNGENYLISIKILSSCTSFIGGITSGTILALILSEGYEYVFYWQEGYYD